MSIINVLLKNLLPHRMMMCFWDAWFVHEILGYVQFSNNSCCCTQFFSWKCWFVAIYFTESVDSLRFFEKNGSLLFFPNFFFNKNQNERLIQNWNNHPTMVWTLDTLAHSCLDSKAQYNLGFRVWRPIVRTNPPPLFLPSPPKFKKSL